MDIKEYSKLIKAKRKELDDLMKRKMPVIAGRMAKDHFQDNFRREGFVNGGLHPWPKAKRLSSGRTDAAGQYGTLLSGRNHLFSSVKYVPGDYRVRVANDLIYAPSTTGEGKCIRPLRHECGALRGRSITRLQARLKKPPQAKERAKRRVLPQAMNRRRARRH